MNNKEIKYTLYCCDYSELTWECNCEELGVDPSATEIELTVINVTPNTDSNELDDSIIEKYVEIAKKVIDDNNISYNELDLYVTTELNSNIFNVAHEVDPEHGITLAQGLSEDMAIEVRERLNEYYEWYKGE